MVTVVGIDHSENSPFTIYFGGGTTYICSVQYDLDAVAEQPDRRRLGSALNRGQFFSAAALAAGTMPVTACSRSGTAYGEAVAQTWRPFAVERSGRRALQRELVRYATLAPSSHNTQCWNFKLQGDRISILPDFARRCPVVDPDDHHLFVSLGCAAENLIIAGLAHGLHGNVSFESAAEPAVRIDFEPAKAVSSALFEAVPRRQCTRAAYDGRPLESAQLRRLEAAASGRGVAVLLLTARAQIEQVLDYVIEGNSAQLDDPAFMKELVHWIRFSDGEAVAKGDGLFSRASGSPSVPRALAAPLFKLLFTPKGDNEKYTRFIRSSAGIAVFVGDSSDHEHWFEIGRSYERFALQATAMGVRTAMLNQPVEVSALRPQFATALGIGSRRPDLVVRFGYGPDMPRSLRRPIDAVIVA